MRSIAFAALVATIAASPLAAQQHNDPDHAVAGAGQLPAGWEARLDRPTGKMSDVMLMPMGGGYHVKLGPSGIFYQPTNTASGAYSVTASFAQNAAPTHPEAYGIFLGGKNLDGANQDYTYFIVRGDGKYMIKHRAGTDVHTINDWTEHAAVKKQDAAGKVTNVLTVDVQPTSVNYLVNGQQVATQSRADVPIAVTNGIAGLRVNHNLDLMVTNFAITRK